MLETSHPFKYFRKTNQNIKNKRIQGKKERNTWENPKSQNVLGKRPNKILTLGRFKKSYTHEFRFKSSQIFFEGSLICFTKNIKMCWRHFDFFQLLDSLLSP